MPTQRKQIRSRVRLHAAPNEPLSAGEHVPLEYPNLYTIKAGDWRISYAVEHNRLAILVLEVVPATEATAGTETAREEMAKIMKVKLLDLPDELAAKTAAPDEEEAVARIRVVGLPDEPPSDPPAPEETAGKPMIRVWTLAADEEAPSAPTADKTRKVRWIETGNNEPTEGSPPDQVRTKARIKLAGRGEP